MLKNKNKKYPGNKQEKKWSCINYSASFNVKMILKEENFERKQEQTQF